MGSGFLKILTKGGLSILNLVVFVLEGSDSLQFLYYFSNKYSFWQLLQ